MTLSSDHFHSLTVAYRESSEVLQQLGNDETNRSLIFELSAAVGCLRTILNREMTDIHNQKAHAHQPTKGQQVFKKGRRRKGNSGDH